MIKRSGKTQSKTRMVAVCMILVLASVFTGCTSTMGDNAMLQNTMVSGEETSAGAVGKANINPLSREAKRA